MFISKVCKSNKNSEKKYEYFRLMSSYRIGKATRQQHIADLGTLENVPREKFKTLADRIEAIVLGNISMLPTDPDIEPIAIHFAKQILDKKVAIQNAKISKKTVEPEPKEKDIIAVDINSLESKDIRTIGGEYLCKQVIEQLEFDKFLNTQNTSETLSKYVLMNIIGRMVHPASDLETERWINDNSDLSMLCNLKEHTISRYKLAVGAQWLYDNKSVVESYLHQKISTLFSLDYQIVIYDLTNLYFEGRKKNSRFCKFGRSKEKRSDCRLVCIALVVDAFGFIQFSRFYAGNQAEPQTLTDVITDLESVTKMPSKKPVILFDAGIATQENIVSLQAKKMDYVCVSRSKLTKYTIVGEPLSITDKDKNIINLKYIEVENKTDKYLLVESEQKKVKEQSMQERFVDKFEQELNDLKKTLQNKRTHKGKDTMNQKLGRLKERHKKISGSYEVTLTADKEDKNIVDITWWRKQVRKEFDGKYFLRYSNPNLTQQQIWDTYNTIREVESTFRCLKTDLKIRPIFHQNDDTVLSHIFVGIVAYQFVNTIRFQLAKKGITLDWTKIMQTMNTYHSLVTECKDENDNLIRLRYCQNIPPKAAEIFDAIGYNKLPFKKQKFVVTKK